MLAGQWKYGQDRLKLQWAEQEDSKNLLAKLKGSKVSASAAAGTPAAEAAAAGWDVLAEAPVDPLTGKLPLLLGAEDLDKQFWTGSKPGRAMLEQVGSRGRHCMCLFLASAAELFACCICTTQTGQHTANIVIVCMRVLLLPLQLQQGGAALAGGGIQP